MTPSSSQIANTTSLGRPSAVVAFIQVRPPSFEMLTPPAKVQSNRVSKVATQMRSPSTWTALTMLLASPSSTVSVVTIVPFAGIAESMPRPAPVAT